MDTLKRYMPFFTSVMLMYVVLLIIYPHYQYFIDPDGIAYLTISQRYASGDMQKAINGYWSPWSCWLTASLIKQSISAIPASVIINTLGATGFLYISQSFFLKFNIIHKLQCLLNVTLAFFLCYAVFWQSFDDLWECFFLLSTLRLMLADNFMKKPALWIVTSFIGTLAYFAKAYSFPFFILNTIVCLYFISKDNKGAWLQVSLIIILTMVVLSHPWIVALHDKYGICTTSTAGPLNMSWYLVGHPHWKAGIDLLIPPAYPDSPYYWEDPWFANGVTLHFWSSWHLLGLQFVRIGLNTWKFLVSNLQLSIFFPVVFIMVLRPKLHDIARSVVSGEVRILAVSFILFPLGYVLINFESRYLWYMLPLAMTIGALLIQNMDGISRKWLIIAFPVTFLIYPTWCMAKIYDEGANEYKTAQQLKQLNIKCAFTAMPKPGIAAQRIERLAYFSGYQYYYSNSRKDITEKDVLRDIRRYHVKYFFVYSGSDLIKDGQGNVFPEMDTHISELKIFLIEP
jgi:hypothetical protein